MPHTILNTLTLTVVLTALGVGTMASAQTGTTKSNIVFILMDNLGYGEVGVYGGGHLPARVPSPRRQWRAPFPFDPFWCVREWTPRIWTCNVAKWTSRPNPRRMSPKARRGEES
jgi:hypothetical protein